MCRAHASCVAGPDDNLDILTSSCNATEKVQMPQAMAALSLKAADLPGAPCAQILGMCELLHEHLPMYRTQCAADDL